MQIQMRVTKTKRKNEKRGKGKAERKKERKKEGVDRQNFRVGVVVVCACLSTPYSGVPNGILQHTHTPTRAITMLKNRTD